MSKIDKFDPPPSIELDGHTTNMLALIAQNPNKRDRDVQKMIKEMEGKAKQIGKCLAGYVGTYEDDIIYATKGLRDWAESLE